MMVSTVCIRFGFKSFLSFFQSNDGRHSLKMVLNGHLGDGLVFLAWPAVGCGHLAIIFVVLLLFVHLGHQACCNIILHHHWCRQLHLLFLQPPIIDHLAVFACAVGHKKGLLQCNDTFKRRQATLHCTGSNEDDIGYKKRPITMHRGKRYVVRVGKNPLKWSDL